jgi:ATP-dependent Clp protease ATP-binding subunit ClpB
VRESVLAELRRTFRPEVLNRIDETVIFKPLTLEEVERIVEIQLSDLSRRLEERRVSLELTPEARSSIAHGSYDPVFGARPIKRYLERHVETPLARKILEGKVPDGSRVLGTLVSGKLEFAVEPASRDSMDPPRS